MAFFRIFFYCVIVKVYPHVWVWGVLRDIPSLAHQREITLHPIVLRKMAEGGRNTRLPSGYAEDFVNAVEEDLQCLICHLPLKEPVQTGCGHRFCKECLEEHFRRLVAMRLLMISG